MKEDTIMQDEAADPTALIEGNTYGAGAAAPAYVLDEIDEVLAAEDDDDEVELDLTAETPLTTDSLQRS